MDEVEAAQGSSRKYKPLIVVAAAFVLIGLSAGLTYLLLFDAPAPGSKGSSQAASLVDPKFQLALFATGLPSPTSIVSAKQAGDARLFVLDQSGVIRIVEANGNVVAEPFLDISPQVLGGGEMGLLGLAFSPNYSQDGFFFINYIDKSQTTVIARYHVSDDVNKADPASAQTVLTLKQPYSNHNGGDLVFGPDGYLYVALGDGGSGGDPEDRAQNLSSLFGKILRLDVSELPYKIPASNPYVNQAGKAGEVWAWGLRNPWRISFDRTTHDLYIADVGQGQLEEINIEPAGGQGGNNYGWRCFEGTKEYNPKNCGPREQFKFPILEYDHSEERCSATGGYVYRGQKYQALVGKYFYSDYCGGQLYFAQKKDNQWQSALAMRSPYKISTFGEDATGELYLADYSTGSIYKIQDSAN